MIDERSCFSQTSLIMHEQPSRRLDAQQQQEEDPALESCHPDDSSLATFKRSQSDVLLSLEQVHDDNEVHEHQTPSPRVRFQEEHDVFFRESNFDKASISDLWYAPANYKAFKDTYKLEAKWLVKYNKQHASRQAVSQAFEDCCACPHDHQVPAHVIETLAQYLQSFPETKAKITTTGLERIASKHVFQDKKQRRQMMLEAVQVIQEAESKFSLDQQQRLIALACREMSLPCRLLAQALAQAAIATKWNILLPFC